MDKSGGVKAVDFGRVQLNGKSMATDVQRVPARGTAAVVVVKVEVHGERMPGSLAWGS